MENITITILVLLSFLLVWVGIMIFTTKPEEEVVEEETVTEKEVLDMQENNEQKNYENIIQELKTKIDQLETKPTNDTLLSWLTELRRDNELLKLKVAHMEGGPSFIEGAPGTNMNKYESEKLRHEIEEHKLKVEALETEVKELKNSINYYRDIVSKLQGSYHVLNKHNYRACIRNPESGEYEYQLVKLPPEFDPFTPTYITREGVEVFEEYGIRVPTKLGDIIREEFKKDVYWKDFELDR